MSNITESRLFRLKNGINQLGNSQVNNNNNKSYLRNKYSEVIRYDKEYNVEVIKYDNGLSYINPTTKILTNENCICMAYQSDIKEEVDLVIKTMNNTISRDKIKRVAQEENEIKAMLRKRSYCPQKMTKMDYELIKLKEGYFDFTNNEMIKDSSNNANVKNHTTTKQLGDISRNSGQIVADDDDNISELSIHDISESPPMPYHMAKLNENRSAISKRRANPVISLIPIHSRGSSLSTKVDPRVVNEASLGYSKAIVEQNKLANSSGKKPEPIFNESFSSIESNRPFRSYNTDQKKQKDLKNPRASSAKSDIKPSRFDTNTSTTTTQFKKSPIPSTNKQYTKVFERFPGVDLNDSSSMITNIFLENESKVYTSTNFENLLKNYAKTYDYDMGKFLKSQKEKIANNNNNNENSKIMDDSLEIYYPTQDSRLSANGLQPRILSKGLLEKAEKKSLLKDENVYKGGLLADKKEFHLNLPSKLPQISIANTKIPLENMRRRSLDVKNIDENSSNLQT